MISLSRLPHGCSLASQIVLSGPSSCWRVIDRLRPGPPLAGPTPAAGGATAAPLCGDSRRRRKTRRESCSYAAVRLVDNARKSGPNTALLLRYSLSLSLVTTIMSQRTSWPFAKLTSPVTFIVRQCAPGGTCRRSVAFLGNFAMLDGSCSRLPSFSSALIASSSRR